MPASMNMPRSRSVARREFLRRVGGTGLAVAGTCGLAAWLYDRSGTAGLPKAAEVALPAGGYAVADEPRWPKLAVVRGTDAAEMVRRGIDAVGGIKRFIRPGDRVVLKPNAAFDRPPALGATTNPEVVAAVARMCLGAGSAAVRVVDNPINNPPRCFEITGIGPAARTAGARVVWPQDADFRPLRIRRSRISGGPDAVLTLWPFFWPPFVDATKVIGLPVAKDHNLCSASLSLKNWYGLLGGRRNRLHQAIHRVVSDLGVMMRPTLVVLDGTRTLLSSGPTGGSLLNVKRTETIAVGTDQVALDAWAYENLLGRDAAGLTYLQMAQTKRAGVRDYRRLKIVDLGRI